MRKIMTLAGMGGALLAAGIWLFERAPASASLSVRAWRRCTVDINGIEIATPSSKDWNWKKAFSIDVGSRLKAGTNDLSVTVFNAQGPPALWLKLAADHFQFISDEGWEASYVGAVWRPAHAAAKPAVRLAGSPLAAGEKMGLALQNTWPLVGVLMLAG